MELIKRQASRVDWQALIGGWPERAQALLLLLALAISVRSIEQANWVYPQPLLSFVLLLAAAAGWIVGKTNVRRLITYPLAALFGFLVILWQAFSLLPPGGSGSRYSQLLTAIQAWTATEGVIVSGGSTLHFSVFLLVIIFIAGFLAFLRLGRKGGIWTGIILSAAIILVNLSNLGGLHQAFFWWWIFSVLLLMGLSGFIRRSARLRESGAAYSSTGFRFFVVTLAALSLLITSIAWFTPDFKAPGLEKLINRNASWRVSMENFLMEFFVAVPSKLSILRSDDQGELLFGDDTFDVGKEPNFIINSPHPSYWRMRTYDTYSETGWTDSAFSESGPVSGNAEAPTEDLQERSQMTYTVLPQLKTDVVLLAGDYIATSLDTSSQSLVPASYSIDLRSSSQDRFLPDEIAALARDIRLEEEGRDSFQIGDIASLVPDDLAVSVPGADSGEPAGATPTDIELTRRYPADVNNVAVKTTRMLQPGETYSVLGSTSQATTEELSEAGTDYPGWVKDHYLQLPDSVTPRVRTLGVTLTLNEETPYDKAVTLQKYLSEIHYTTEVKAPPRGRDGVDYFLYTARAGNCVNFASSMAVLLRSVGVPTRIAVGYSPGEWDAESESTVLTEKQRHAWPEVYFPGYGWIVFEATPLGDQPLEGRAFTGSEGFDNLDEALMALEGVDEGISAGGVGTAQRQRPTFNFAVEILLFLLGLFLVYLFFSRLSRRGRQTYRPGYASIVYGRMSLLGTLLNLKARPYQTPQEYGTALTALFPHRARAIENVVQSYMMSRFSRRKQLTFLQTRSLRQSWKELYPVMIKRFFHLR